MKKDDYKIDFEEQRKEIDLPDGEEIQSRVELHSKSTKKESRFSLVNVLLIIFTLIPITILAFVFISLNLSKDPITPQADEDGIQFETIDKSNDDADLGEKEKKEQEEKEKKAQEEKEKEEKELARAEEEKKKEAARQKEKEKQEAEARKEAARKKEEERQKEEARQKELARQQAEKEKQQAEDNKNQNQNEPSAGGKTHTVAPGETLYRISVNYYQSGDGVNKIRQANGLSSNDISVGQTLIIP